MSEPTFLLCDCVHCGNHIEFPPDAVGMVFDCPHCSRPTLLTVPLHDAIPQAIIPAGTPPARPSWKSWLPLTLGTAGFAVLTVASIIAFRNHLKKSETAYDQAGQAPTSTVANPAPEPEPPPTPRQPGEDIQLLRHKIEKAAEGSLRYISGIVTNHGDKQVFNVRIEFEMLNAQGQVVGTAKDYLGNLGAHTDWDFRAQIVDPDAVKPRLLKLSSEKE